MTLILSITSFLSCGLGYLFATKASRFEHQHIHARFEDELIAERDQVNHLRAQTEQQVQALTTHVAKLEANMLRINSLGGRLVKLAELDPQEFQFDIEPGVGGPMEVVDELPLNALPELLHKMEQVFDIRYQQMSKLQHIFQYLSGREGLEFGPVAKPVAKGWVSSFYGYRIDPFTGKKAWHRGVDIAGKAGSAVQAVAAGVVVKARESGSYGNVVEIKHGNGFVTRYAHNQALKVKKGDLIKKGDTIALMGSSGRSTGPHLHFEVHKDGKPIDPGSVFSDLKRKG